MKQHLTTQSNTVLRTAGQSVTVWHDGACPLCTREIAQMRLPLRAMVSEALGDG